MPTIVRAALKVMDLLEALNQHNGSTTSELAIIVGLPRGTTFRFVDTLEQGGYVKRDEKGGRVWLTKRVRWLSEGFREHDTLVDVAKPIIDKLGAEVLWPISLVTPLHLGLITRTTTDFNSPFTEIPSPPGHPIHPLVTAAGFVYLANSSPEKRDLILRHSGPWPSVDEETVERNKVLFFQDLERIRNQGFAQLKGLYRSAAVSVPIMLGDEVAACLSMRYFSTAVKPNEIEKKYVPILRKYVDLILDAIRPLSSEELEGERVVWIRHNSPYTKPD